MAEETTATETQETKETAETTKSQETETQEIQETKETKETKATETQETKESSDKDKNLLGDKPTLEIRKEAPEKYGDFKIPEGMELDTALLEKYDPAFKGLKLSQEEAQGLIDLYVEQKQAEVVQFNEMTEGWKQETIKELGADYQEKLAITAKVIDKFGGDRVDKVREILKDTGLGNHPEIVNLFINVGKAISDDNMAGGVNANTPTSEDVIAEKLFPNTKHNR